MASPLNTDGPQLREIFPHADQVGKFTVFNIAGNKVRLIAAVHPTPLSCAETARVWLCKPQKRGWDDKKTFNDLRRAIGQEQEMRDWERSSSTL